jgi:hypothetical protein
MTMKTGKKIFLKIIISLAITVFVGSALCILYPILLHLYLHGFMFFADKVDQQKQVRLLCKTNHKALLKACRELSRRCARGDLKPGRYYIGYDQEPEASQFPQLILNLKPSYVFIDDDGWVKLEMIGGLDHFGVNAYTEDYKMPSWGVYGDEELIPGLWYYDDGYRGHPEYEKRIEALMQKGK